MKGEGSTACRTLEAARQSNAAVQRKVLYIPTPRAHLMPLEVHRLHAIVHPNGWDVFADELVLAVPVALMGCQKLQM